MKHRGASRPADEREAHITVDQVRGWPSRLGQVPAAAQTEPLCLAAVQAEGLALRYVKIQTPAVCEAAIEQDPHALQFVTDQTPHLCRMAVRADGKTLQYVANQTPELVWTAIRQTGLALSYVNKQTPMMCLDVVGRDGLALEYVRQQTPDICKAAVESSGAALQFVKHQTPEVCLAAVSRWGVALEYVHDQAPEICLAALQDEGFAIQFVKDQTLALCRAAVRSESLALEHVRLPRDELALPGSGQLDTWRVLLKDCGPIDRECAENAVIPLIQAIPLGKAYCDEWCQRLPNGQRSIDALVDLAGEIARISPPHQAVTDFIHRVNQQQEWILRRQLSVLADPVPTHDYGSDRDTPL